VERNGSGSEISEKTQLCHNILGKENPVFRIRISLNADPDPGFYLISDPDSGFWILDFGSACKFLKLNKTKLKMFYFFSQFFLHFVHFLIDNTTKLKQNFILLKSYYEFLEKY